MSSAKRTLAPTRVAGTPAAPAQEGGDHPARVGTILAGKYHLDRVLGAGGMAVVFAATHRNQKQLAIKMLKPELAGLPDVRKRFLQEGYAANSVRHPGTVSVVDDAVSEDGCPFLVMELLDGVDVQTCLKARKEPFPVQAVLALGYQLLDVLAAAHEREILHRDIKPANLLITTDGTLKVLDFGIARVRAVIHSERSGQGGKVTMEGMAIGTPAFMPPEQALGLTSEVDGRADIWSAGATLFTCLSLKGVHDARGDELIGLARTTQARPLASVVPDVPASVAGIIDRALAFRTEQRWPSAAAMRHAIAATYEELYGKAVSPAPLVKLLRARSEGPSAAPDSGKSNVDASTVPRPGDDLEAPPAPTAGDVLTEVPSAAGTAAKPVVRDEAALPSNARTRRVAVTAAAVGATLILVVAWIGIRGASSSKGTAANPSLASSDSAGTISPASSGTSAPPAVSLPPVASVQPDAAASRTPSPPSASAVVSARPPRTKPPSPAVRPCRLVATRDERGETHFSCPCDLSRCVP